MEEGKRMFSIFAARMFEQRVLQAYCEKLAQDRQQQLLRQSKDESVVVEDKRVKFVMKDGRIRLATSRD